MKVDALKEISRWWVRELFDKVIDCALACGFAEGEIERIFQEAMQ